MEIKIKSSNYSNSPNISSSTKSFITINNNFVAVINFSQKEFYSFREHAKFTDGHWILQSKIFFAETELLDI